MKICPKCEKYMERQDGEPDVGIVGGWYCTECDTYIEDEDDGEG